MSDEATQPDSPIVNKGEQQATPSGEKPLPCYKFGKEYQSGDTYTDGVYTWECENGQWVFQG